MIFNNEKAIYRKFIRPDTQGILQVNGRAYNYKPDAILHTRHTLLAEMVPALIYEQETPDPLDVFARVPSADGVSVTSSSQYSKILDDRTVSEFVAAQSSISPRQIMYSIYLSALMVAVVVVVATFYIFQEVQKLQPALP
ncbi:hypothetical protein LCGC14_1827750 [marine sediment metagenome]|uniref:Uncharacterized protein n=1 Tax=marine sediment metagenome TaxID=412755 RepID=A0A0F9GGZ2_9ZZZZ